LEVELRVEGVARARIDRLLRPGEAFRRGRRKVRAQRFDLLREGGVVDALPDEAPRRRLLGGELVAEHRKPDRTGGADESRQEIGPARVGNEPEVAERLDEARGSRRDDEVAREREVGARARGNAVQRADDGNRQGPYPSHERTVILLDG